ncbi:hypothetical protein V1512DRAFT_267289 [Lipomyces arxii]|uniref:uncharacterized protein n=1 Tax=Lipomyces arxii TaxID=56418 RepID=UPI0034CE9C25
MYSMTSLRSAAANFQSPLLPTATAIHPEILTTMDRLDEIAPRFFLQQGQIDILKSPKEFYSVLKSKILQAKTRVFLASLYIGKTEVELIDCIRTALRVNPSLKVSLLTDALRGTREAPNKCSASLMSELSEEFADRVEIRLFHTPNLYGLSRLIIPKRINEGWGLQHMKLYGFDDEVILSGANLSNDYFTNRQDRYYFFKCSQITEYYKKLFDAVSSLSYLLIPDRSSSGFRLQWPATNRAPEPTKRALKYMQDATKLLVPLLRPSQSMSSGRVGLNDSLNMTVVYPISQMTPLLSPNVSTEFLAIQRLLNIMKLDGVSWMFTAGYFNIYSSYRDMLLNSNTKDGVVVTAAPEANGFYESAGISKYLPQAYTLLAKNFVQDVNKRHKSSFIHLLEWKNGVLNQPGGWTYHAKGIWIATPNAVEPCITVVGSSNFTRRSQRLDLESGAIVITRDAELQRQMNDEVNNLKTFATEMKEKDFDRHDRKVGWGVKIALYILGGML